MWALLKWEILGRNQKKFSILHVMIGKILSFGFNNLIKYPIEIVIVVLLWSSHPKNLILILRKWQKYFWKCRQLIQKQNPQLCFSAIWSQIIKTTNIYQFIFVFLFILIFPVLDQIHKLRRNLWIFQ